MPSAITEIVDSDGHIHEQDADLYTYLEPKYGPGVRKHYFFPSLDGWQRGALSRNALGEPVERRGDRPVQIDDVAGWLRFLDDAEIASSVLYPTPALGFGYVKDPGWAIDLARAYNDFVSDHYLKVTPRLKAVALLPVQDPDAAAAELRRAVDELGMVGGLLPAMGLRIPYGDPAFDPLYAEAVARNVPLAVHGAPQQGLGFEFFENFAQGMVLSHPMSLMIQFTNMIGERVFDRFPGLRVAYLEAGAGWVPYLVERIDQRTERSGRRLASEQVRDHPIYFHAELEEREVLRTALDVIGDDRFIYASDYPHEPASAITHALQEFLTREDISDASKRKILCDNTKALYGIT